tara:strand:- start:507 stop:1253 length:747 start_codon:yes stop_codon:yes gene_type:complete
MKISLSFPIKEKCNDYYVSKIQSNKTLSFTILNIDDYSIDDHQTHIYIPFEKLESVKMALNMLVNQCSDQIETNSYDWFQNNVTASRIKTMTRFSDRNNSEIRLYLSEAINYHSYDEFEHEIEFSRSNLMQNLLDGGNILKCSFEVQEIHFYQQTAIFHCVCTHIDFSNDIDIKECKIEVEEETVSLSNEDIRFKTNISSELQMKKEKLAHLKIVSEYIQKEFEQKQKEMEIELNKIRNDVDILTNEL